jgi:RNA recognition motif-containing protein
MIDMNIYVGNLPLDLTENELRQEFLSFGEVLSVTIMNDQCIGSGCMSRYGFVEMSSKYDGKTAINNLTGKMIKGRVINVIEALPLSNARFINGRNVRYFGRKDIVRTY